MDASAWVLVGQTIVLAAALLPLAIQVGFIRRQASSAQRTERARFQHDLLSSIMQTRLELQRAAPGFGPLANVPVIEQAGGTEQYIAIRNTIDKFNSAFHLRRQGYLDDETWGTVEAYIQVMWENPRLEQIWGQLMDRPGRFYPAFREYIDGLYVTAPEESTTPGTLG